MTSEVKDGMSAQTADSLKITDRDLVRSALNVGALGMEYSWTYYKQMNIAFCLMISGMLKKIYHDDEEGYWAAVQRHLAFFNITVQLAPFVGGIAVSMEERVAKGELEPEAVNDVKAALMGPLSGIGDSIFLATIRVVAAAIGISLAQAGSLFAPIVFLLIYNVPAFWLRVWGVRKGYSLGVNFLTQAQESGTMEKVLFGAGIIGACVIGAMTSSMFYCIIPIPIGVGDATQTFQDILDGIMPGVLGLGAMWLYYWLLSKKVSPMWLIVGTMVLGIIGAYFGFLASAS